MYPHTIAHLVNSILQFVYIVQIACGAHHSIARSAKETIYSWGSGSFGQLGHGENHHELTPRPVNIFLPINITAF